MTIPPAYHLVAVGPQAQMMSRNCTKKHLAMVLHHVNLGPVITRAEATQLLIDAFTASDHESGRSR